VADLTDDLTLLDVSIGGHIKIMFCLHEEDSENVFLAISARAMGPDLNIRSKFNLALHGVEDKELGHDIHFATGGINHKLDAGDKLIVIGPVRSKYFVIE